MSFLITSWDALSLFPYLKYNNFMSLNERWYYIRYFMKVLVNILEMFPFLYLHIIQSI